MSKLSKLFCFLKSNFAILIQDCGSVPDIPNASTQGRIERNSVKDREPVATAAFYSCEKEAIFIGPTTTGDVRLKCLDDTNWEEPDFSCVRGIILY